MKKAKMILMAGLIGALVLAVPALAEQTGPDSIVCSIEDGNYIIRIPDAEGDLGWVADEPAEEEPVVKLASAELQEDEFVIVYAPASDGETTVSARHFTGIACDTMHTWDLKVENGAITENTGGSYTAVPSDEELEPLVTGDWIEKDTEFTTLHVERNQENGFDIEIVSPMTHGAYIFKTTAYNDCEKIALVYDKGKFWDLPEDGDTESDLGEAGTMGTTGTLSIGGEDEEHLTVTWHDDEGEEIVFTRPETEAAAE